MRYFLTNRTYQFTTSEYPLYLATPVNNESNVFITNKIVCGFGMPMSNVSTNGIVIKNSSGTWSNAGTWDVSNPTQFVFSPALNNPMPPNENIEVSFLPTIKDVGGALVIASKITFQFRTIEKVVNLYTPVSGDQNVTRTNAIKLIFNLPMDDSITNQIQIVSATKNWSNIGTWNVNGGTNFTFTPNVLPYYAGTIYEIKIPKTIQTIFGGPILRNDIQYLFKTKAIYTIFPENGQADISAFAPITIIGDIEMNSSFVSNISLSYVGSTELPVGEWTVASNRIFRFTPVVYRPWLLSKTIRVVVSTNAIDSFGNRLFDNFQTNIFFTIGYPEITGFESDSSYNTFTNINAEVKGINFQSNLFRYQLVHQKDGTSIFAVSEKVNSFTTGELKFNIYNKPAGVYDLKVTALFELYETVFENAMRIYDLNKTDLLQIDIPNQIVSINDFFVTLYFPGYVKGAALDVDLIDLEGSKIHNFYSGNAGKEGYLVLKIDEKTKSKINTGVCFIKAVLETESETKQKIGKIIIIK